MEAKDEDDTSDDRLFRRALGQSVEYAAFVPGGPPPYLMVLDVGSSLIVWNRCLGTYGELQAVRLVEMKTPAQRTDA